MIAALLLACERESATTPPAETSTDSGVPVDPHDGPEVLLEDAARTVFAADHAWESSTDGLACAGGLLAIGTGADDEIASGTWGRVTVYDTLPPGVVGVSAAATWEVVGTKDDRLTPPRVLLPGDLDGDGSPDVVAGGRRWSLDGPLDLARPDGILREVGEGTLAGDVDADGVPDLWLRDHAEATARWTLVPGPGFVGELARDHLEQAPDWDPAGHLEGAPDLTGDGVPDALFSNPSYGVSVLAGPRSGWAREALRLSPPEGAQVGPAAVGDLDADGAADLVVGISEYDTPSRVGVWFGPVTADDTLLAPDLVIVGEVQNGHFGGALAVADLDGDGDLDLAVGASGAGPGTVSVFPGPFVPGALTGADAPLVYAGPEPYTRAGRVLAACDLDGDGAAELVVNAGIAGLAPHADTGVYVVPGGPIGGGG